MHQRIDIRPNQHPIETVRVLRRRYGSPLVLRFSRYTHTPKALTDLRESFAVDSRRVTSRWLRQVLGGLRATQELAMESRVKYKGRNRHVPMLDFKGMGKGQLAAVMKVIPKAYLKGMLVYFTGRSFHAYFPHLLTTREWTKFMGTALLCNDGQRSVVDQRWVGRRLVGGYAALRWSCSSARHKQFPIRVPPEMLNLPFADKQKVVYPVSRSFQETPHPRVRNPASHRAASNRTAPHATVRENRHARA